jgi:hypothetical protein
VVVLASWIPRSLDENTPKPKVQLLNYIKERAGVQTFVGGYRDDRLNIADYHE